MDTIARFIRMGIMELVDHPTHRPGKVARLTDRGREVLARWRAA